MNIFKKLFAKKSIEIPIENESTVKTSYINRETIKQFDDVWIKTGNVILEGWIANKVRNELIVVYSDINKKLQEECFLLERPYDKTFIKKGDKILIFNKSEI